MVAVERKAEEEEGDHKMKFRFVKKDERSARIIFEDSNYAEMNFLRRALMFEVPVMAIEDVYFTKNSSPLYDEMVAQRLGLVPLSTDLVTYRYKDACKCKGKGCSRCEVKLSVALKGPATLYAKDIKSTDSRVKPVYDETPITKLGKNQEIVFEAIASLGTGRTHMKWSPALVYYIAKPSVKIDSAKAKKFLKEIIEACPSKVIEEKAGKLVVNEDLLLNDDLAVEQVKYVSDKFDGVKLTEDDSKFIFIIESWGQLPIDDMLKRAKELMVEEINSAKLK